MSLGIPSYKMRQPVMRTFVEKILNRIRFDEDDDVLGIFANQVYFQALWISQNFTQSDAINQVKKKVQHFLATVDDRSVTLKAIEDAYNLMQAKLNYFLAWAMRTRFQEGAQPLKA